MHVQLSAALALEVLRGVDGVPVALFALALALCAELRTLALEVLGPFFAFFAQADSLALALFTEAEALAFALLALAFASLETCVPLAFALEGVVRALVGRAQRRLAVDGLELGAHRGDGVGGDGFLGRRRFDVLEVSALRLQGRGLDAETRRGAVR